MSGKITQLQIRVSIEEKRTLRRAARKAELSLSEYVLSRALPNPSSEFERVVSTLRSSSDTRFVLAELNDFLRNLDAAAFIPAVSTATVDTLDTYMANYVAAMVEVRAHQLGLSPPAWTKGIIPLTDPVFVGGLESLRLHLLIASPPPFRNRGIFVDATVGDRC